MSLLFFVHFTASELWQNLLEIPLWLTNYLCENKRRAFATDYGWNSKNPQACIWQLDSSIRVDDFRWLSVSNVRQFVVEAILFLAYRETFPFPALQFLVSFHLAFPLSSFFFFLQISIQTQFHCPKMRRNITTPYFYTIWIAPSVKLQWMSSEILRYINCIVCVCVLYKLYHISLILSCMMYKEWNQ